MEGEIEQKEKSVGKVGQGGINFFQVLVDMEECLVDARQGTHALLYPLQCLQQLHLLLLMGLAFLISQ